MARSGVRSESGVGSWVFESLSSLFGDSPQPEQNGYPKYEMDASSPYGARGSHNGAMMQQSPHAGNEDQDAEEDDETSEREDLLDQHVAYYMKHHPEVRSKHNLVRVRPGVYNFDGREISVEWHYAERHDEQGYLICVDGPLRQPFADYMANNENDIEYDDKRLGRSALSQVPKGKRLSFGDGNKVYSRLEAMKVAKEQALVREKAADFVTNGWDVPQHELMTKYQKTLSQKLGDKRQRRPDPEAPPSVFAQPQAPAPAPVAAPAPAPAPRAAPVALPPPPPATASSGAPSSAPSAANEKAPRTHGAPKYCSNHDQTQKRKKTKPHNKACTLCQTVIQTNYVEFKLCPGCSEKDHQCMCCGNPAVGVASSPKAAEEAPSSPRHAHARASRSPAPQSKCRSPARSCPPSKSPMNSQSPMNMYSMSGQGQSPFQSPMNLFGLPDLFGAKATQDPQNGGGYANAGVARMRALSPRGNAYASNNAFASHNPMASQNAYASQNVYASQNQYASQNPMSSQNGYNAMASQNIMAGRQF